MTDTICNEVGKVHPWTKEEKSTLRRIITHALRAWPSLARSYSQCQMSLVQKAGADYDWKSVAAFDCELIRLFEAGEADQVLDMMADKVKTSMDRFYPDCTLLDYLQFVKEYSERRLPQSTSAARPATAH